MTRATIEQREGRGCSWCKRPPLHAVQPPYPPSAEWERKREAQRLFANRQPYLLTVGELVPGVCFDCIIRVYDAMRAFADAGQMMRADVHLGDDR